MASETYEGRLKVIAEHIDKTREIVTYSLHLDGGGSLILDFGSEPAPALLTDTLLRVTGSRRSEVFEVIDYVVISTAPLVDENGLRPIMAEQIDGQQNFVVLVVNFQDNTAQPHTISDITNALNVTANSYYYETSYQRVTINATVHGYLTMPINVTCDKPTIATQARLKATQSGINLNGVTRFIYVIPFGLCPNFYAGSIGGNPSEAWMDTSMDSSNVSHELGHNFGLTHAFAIDCGAASLANDPGTCTYEEYGDPFDVMGGTRFSHFNAMHKEQLGWVATPSTLGSVTASGIYSIYPIESNPVAGQMTKGLKIVAPISNRTYYLEYRQPLGFDNQGAVILINQDPPPPTNVFKGLLMHFDNAGNSTLLDQTPGSAGNPGDWNDAALEPGYSFVDPAGGLAVTPVSVSSTSLQVRIRYGVQTNTSQNVSISVPTNGATVSGKQQIEVNASDADGIIRVEFFVDGQKLEKDISPPYQFSWDSTLFSNGSHTLLARSYDSNNTTAEMSIAVNVSNTAPGGGLVWNTSYGQTGIDSVASIAVASDGSVLVAGQDPRTYGNFAANIGYVKKFAANGTLLWTRSLTGSYVRIIHVAVAANGTVGLSGIYQGNLSLPTTNKRADQFRYFYLLYDTDGTALADADYDIGYTDSAEEYFCNGRFDTDNKFIWSGSFRGDFRLGTLGPVTSRGGRDLFAIKINPTTNVTEWLKHYGIAIDENAHDMAVLANYDLLVVGDRMLTKYRASDGGLVWIQIPTVGGPGTGSFFVAKKLALDADGSFAVFGHFIGTLTFGSNTLVSRPGKLDTYVAKYTAAGAVVWARALLGPQATTLAVNPQHDVFVGSSFDEPINLDSRLLTQSGEQGIFLIKLAAATGNTLWYKDYKTLSPSGIADLKVDATGNVFLTGTFKPTLALGRGWLTTNGMEDVYLAKYPPGYFPTMLSRPAPPTRFRLN